MTGERGRNAFQQYVDLVYGFLSYDTVKSGRQFRRGGESSAIICLLTLIIAEGLHSVITKTVSVQCSPREKFIIASSSSCIILHISPSLISFVTPFFQVYLGLPLL